MYFNTKLHWNVPVTNGLKHVFDLYYITRLNYHDNIIFKFYLYTKFLKKKEVGISGSKVDVERSCTPSCQEYNGNTRVNYLIDRVSCCRGNYCNSQTILKANILLYAIPILCLKFIFVWSEHDSSEMSRIRRFIRNVTYCFFCKYV